MRRAHQPGKNWKEFAAFPKCRQCERWERVEFRYFTGDLAAVIMFCAKAGWQYVNGAWYCEEHRNDNVAS